MKSENSIYVCTRYNTITSVHGIESLPTEAEKACSENRKEEKYLHGHTILSCFLSLNLCDNPTKTKSRLTRLKGLVQGTPVWPHSRSGALSTSLTSGNLEQNPPCNPADHRRGFPPGTSGYPEASRSSLTCPISPLLFANLEGEAKGDE